MRHIIIIIAALCILTGCWNAAEKKYRIGVSQCSGDYWREKTNEEMKRELLLHDDVDIEIRNADNDNLRQIEDVRYFMDNDFDLILVSPNETAPLTPVVREAFAEGIPVVTFDRSILGDSVTAHFEVDNYDLGRSVAAYARSITEGKLNVLEIQGPENASPARLRHSGFADTMAGYDDAVMTASVYGNWDDGLAEILADSILKEYPEINVIYAHTDHMAIGASRAARNHGRDDIAILGIDGFPHIGIKEVKEGNMTATFLYPSEGERLLRLAISILKGEPYEKVTKLPALSPIDKDNADIFLAQEALLESEASKINLLHEELNTFLSRYSSQRMLLGAATIILLLLGISTFLLLKTIRAHKRHRVELLQKNLLLEEEKDKQKELYDQLQEATRSKLMFFTNVSHDLRTPLTLIANPVEEIAEAQYLSDRHKSMMRLARKNIHILRRLIDQILDFRKFENGKVDLNLTEANLPALLGEWTDVFKDAALRRNIRLSCQMPEGDSGAEMAIDAEKMERVFFNLMSNAFKHTPDNGKITVAFGKDADNAWFSVKDNGEGMTREDAARVFDRFFQVDKINPNGSGIGLALTKAFVELHGGSIRVETTKGSGSEFTVILPICHCGNRCDTAPRITAGDVATELAPAKKEDEVYDNEKPVMLIIDDNKDIQKLISDILGDSYNYIYAPDGRQGVGMAIKYVPDIILCDVMMPVMDGMECVRCLRSEVSTSHIPVLMLTACSLDEQRAEGYDSGADGYLSKPFSGKVLAARCRNMLESRRRIETLYGKAGNLGAGMVPSGKKKPTSVAAPNDVESEFYTRFAEIVKERLSNPSLTVDEIAASLNLSQSQLTRKIKALTNYTPVELIRNARLQYAGTLLRSTEKNISEIAQATGFTSLAYFSKCFKDAFGQTPSEVRGK